jgi:hypothetical protein
MADTVTLLQQLRCAERELRQRKRLYPKLVRQETMPQARAAQELACMAAIVDTLKTLLEASYGQQELFPCGAGCRAYGCLFAPGPRPG